MIASPNAFCSFQVLDYGIVLKLDDGPLAIKMLCRMIKLLCLLARGRHNGYVRACILQLLIVLHQKRHNLPAWQMLEASVSTFNEEAGEMSFSMLARAVLGDTLKSKHEHLSKLYSMIHVYLDCEKEFYLDRFSMERKKNYRRNVADDEEVIDTVASYVNGILREITKGHFLVYDGKKASFDSKLVAARHLKEIRSRVPLWVDDIRKTLLAHLSRAEELFISDWGSDRYFTIWPEIAHKEIEGLPSVPGADYVLDQSDHDDEQLQSEDVLEAKHEHEEHQVASQSTAQPSRSSKCLSDDSDSSADSGDESSDGHVPSTPVGDDVDEQSGGDETPDKHRKRWCNVDDRNVLPRRPRERPASRAPPGFYRLG